MATRPLVWSEGVTLDIDTAEIVPNLVRSGVVLLIALVFWWVVTRLGKRWLDRVERRQQITPSLAKTLRADQLLGEEVVERLGMAEQELAEHELAERHQRFVTLWSVIRALLAVAVAAVVVLVLLGIWGIPIAPFLAVGSVIGLGISFGAQDYVKSVIAGFMIIIEDQYSIGDVITVAGVSGKVEKIRLRTTVLRDLEGNVHHVPNGFIDVASNLTQGFAAVVVDVGVGYGEDVDRAIEVVTDEANRLAGDPEWEALFLDEPQVLGVNLLGDWSVQIRVVLTTTPDQRWSAKREFLRRIKKRLDAEGIEIPFPYRTIVEKRPAAQ